MVYCELGKLPLIVTRKLRIFKYWLKLKDTDNCILMSCLKERCDGKDPWILNIKNELSMLGLEYLWESELTPVTAYKIIEQRLLDVCKQNMFANVSNSPKGLIYQHVIDHFSLGQNKIYVCLSSPDRP